MNYLIAIFFGYFAGVVGAEAAGVSDARHIFQWGVATLCVTIAVTQLILISKLPGPGEMR